MQLLNQDEIQTFLQEAGSPLTFGATVIYALDHFNDLQLNDTAQFDLKAANKEFLFMTSSKYVLDNNIVNGSLFISNDSSFNFSWKVINTPDHLGDGFARLRAIRSGRTEI